MDENTSSETPEQDTLVVASKVKKYIREKSGMNTSASLLDALSEQVRTLCEQAALRAKADGRKTVMDRDLVRPPDAPAAPTP
ncbi:MAG: hypothetical protein AABZ30_09845 [Myxococcota bacterium]